MTTATSSTSDGGSSVGIGRKRRMETVQDSQGTTRYCVCVYVCVSGGGGGCRFSPISCDHALTVTVALSVHIKQLKMNLLGNY